MTAEELRRIRDHKIAVLLSRHGLADSGATRIALEALFDDLLAQLDTCIEVMEKGMCAVTEANIRLERKVTYYESLLVQHP